MMIEKQHFVFENSIYYRDLRFYNRDYPGSDRDPGGFFDYAEITSQRHMYSRDLSITLQSF